MKILFILKYGASYGYCNADGGLYSSAKFVVDMLAQRGRAAKLVQVIDNNDIDREVTSFRPDVVVIEALWVVPEKFDILARLHPTVKWVIRVHSDFPFLSNEGIAMGWLFDYLKRPNVSVAFNKEVSVDELQKLTDKHVLFLPNFYPSDQLPKIPSQPGTVNVGCFGAIRPLKNQLVQAMAAIEYAEERNKVCFFHINSSRCEGGGDEALKNIRALFANTKHQLLEHPWLSRANFLSVMQRMDVDLAVSFSETFCIVAADALACNVPIVVSDQIPWAKVGIVRDPTSVSSIVDSMSGLFMNRFLNWKGLQRYANESMKIWIKFTS